MPFALVLIGLAMIITGAKDTHMELGDQLVKDFTGEKNFTIWLAAIGSVGAVGYVKDFQPVSRIFMVLIIITMVIRNGGFFDQFTSALTAGPEAIPRPGAPTGAAGDNATSKQFPFGGTMNDWLGLKLPTLTEPDWAKSAREGGVSIRDSANQHFQQFMTGLPSFLRLLGIP